MHKDFHLYGTYLAARLAGFDKDQAVSIACAAQAVDDFTYGEYGSFQGKGRMGTTFRKESKDILQTLWTTFHFLPSGIGNGRASDHISKELQFATAPSGILFDKLGSDLTTAFKASETTDYKLAQAGVTMHVLADTFAHCGFSGIISDTNTVENVSITMNKKEIIKIGISSSTATMGVPVWVADIFDSAKIGHGTAGIFPDISWIEYTFSYKSNRNGDNPEYRHNPTIFTNAFRKMYQVLVSALNNINPTCFDDSSILNILEGIHDFKTNEYSQLNSKKIVKEDFDDTFKLILNEKILLPNDMYNSSNLDNEYKEYLESVNKIAEEAEDTIALSKSHFIGASIWHRGNVKTKILEDHPDFPNI